MQYITHVLVYPEGDTKPLRYPLRINQLVDLNGSPLRLPLRTTRVIAYRVHMIRTRDTMNELTKEYHLVQLYPDELSSLLADDI